MDKEKESEGENLLEMKRTNNVLIDMPRQMVEEKQNQFLKTASLIVLVFQTTASTLVMRYSRTLPGEKYISSTAVCLQEVIKLVTCALILALQSGSLTKACSAINDEVVQKPFDTLKVAVPAFIYTVQNNLIYVAVSNLDAGTYQVTYQLKILTTALFAVAMLGKKLQVQQWVSLGLLFLGVAIVQVDQNSGAEASAPKKDVNPILGLTVVVISSLTSGFAGIYFEKVLKSSRVSLWIRNIQLAVFSVLLAFIGAFLNDGSAIMSKGFLHAYSPIVWVVIGLQAFGGLTVAMVVKYADNILKGFATSVSIVASVVLSLVVFGQTVSSLFAVGTGFVVVSIYLYSYNGGGAPKKNHAPIHKS